MNVVEVLLAVLAVIVVVYVWSKHTFSYWKRKNVPYFEPTPIIGNTKVVFQGKNSFGMHLADLYMHPKVADEAVVGVYALHTPGLLIRDPALLKSVLVKDFNKFSNRNVNSDPIGDPLSHFNLFFAKNPVWKQIRNKLSPVFTSGKIKQMYPLMLQVGHDLEKHLSTYETVNGSFKTDVKELCGRFTTDLITTIAFGIRTNSLADSNAKFREIGRKVFTFNLKRGLEFFIAFFLPNLAQFLRIKLFPADATIYLRKSFTEVILDREASGFKRNDVIDILVDLKKEAELNPNQDSVLNQHKDFLLAQASIFFTAGFETSSSTMSFCFFELARNPAIQKHLREEIQQALARENGQLCYDTIQSLEYLGMVVDETLRMYPILPFLDRKYEDVVGEPSFNLKPYYDFTLPNGMPVYISVYGLHNDPKYWVNPRQFDPERFSNKNKKNIAYMTYMPFGDGSRICIGSRIGLLQTKIGLVHFLKNHYIELGDNNEDMTFDGNSFLMSFKNTLNLKIIRDNLFENSQQK